MSRATFWLGLSDDIVAETLLPKVGPHHWNTLIQRGRGGENQWRRDKDNRAVCRDGAEREGHEERHLGLREIHQCVTLVLCHC